MTELDRACAHFRELLQKQLERVEVSSVTPGTSPKGPVVIGVLQGDGIGSVIVPQAVRVLQLLLREKLHSGAVVLKNIEGLTIEERLAAGVSVPDRVLEQIKQCDVLLKGPTTTPMGGTMESANVTLRRELDLYANVRPITIPEEGIDWVFFRENTEGEYALGSCGIDLPGLSVDFKVTSDFGTRRIAKAALEYARKNAKTNLAVVTKANIMKKTDGRFQRIVHEEALAYPEIRLEDWYIDIMTANLLNPTIRDQFQVMVLPNLYGDIITDEAAQLQGGVGSAGSANIGDRYAMFEAVHGSAPRMMEAGLGKFADPRSILRAMQLLLRHIAETEAAQRLEKALADCAVKITGDENGATCEAYVDTLLQLLTV